jgi:hypothetical protein
LIFFRPIASTKTLRPWSLMRPRKGGRREFQSNVAAGAAVVGDYSNKISRRHSAFP